MSDVGDDDVGEDAGASGGRRRRLDDGDGDGDDDDGGGASSSTSSDSGSGGAGDERNREEAELLPDFAYTNLTELAMANMSLAIGGGGVGGSGFATPEIATSPPTR